MSCSDGRATDVRYATANLIVDAYLGAGRQVPISVVDRLEKMARSDGDRYVRRVARDCLREPRVESDVEE